MVHLKLLSPKMVVMAGLVAVLCLLPGSAISHGQTPFDNLSVIDSEIDILNQDTAWLKFKIDRFKNDGRSIPEAFHRSLALKEKKLNALVFLKKKYLETIKNMPVPPIRTTVHVSDLSQKQPAAPASDPITSKTGISASKLQLTDKLKKSGLSEWVELVEEKGLLKIENSLPILFASGKAAVAKEYQPFFKNMADLVKPYDVRIIVEGYADTDPIHTRQYPSNFELGAARAANVVHELTRYGVKPSVFKIESTGEHRFVSGKPFDKKALERHVRLSIIILPQTVL